MGKASFHRYINITESISLLLMGNHDILRAYLWYSRIIKKIKKIKKCLINYENI